MLWFCRQNVDPGGTAVVGVQHVRGDMTWDFEDKWFMVFR
jgi:hypothetical protein